MLFHVNDSWWSLLNLIVLSHPTTLFHVLSPSTFMTPVAFIPFMLTTIHRFKRSINFPIQVAVLIALIVLFTPLFGTITVLCLLESVSCCPKKLDRTNVQVIVFHLWVFGKDSCLHFFQFRTKGVD